MRGARRTLEHDNLGMAEPGLGGGVVGRTVDSTFSIPQVGGGLAGAVIGVRDAFRDARPFRLQLYAFDFSTPRAQHDPPFPDPQWRALGGLGSSVGVGGLY